MNKKTLFDYFEEIGELIDTACSELNPIDFDKLKKDIMTLIESFE